MGTMRRGSGTVGPLIGMAVGAVLTWALMTPTPKQPPTVEDRICNGIEAKISLETGITQFDDQLMDEVLAARRQIAADLARQCRENPNDLELRARFFEERERCIRWAAEDAAERQRRAEDIQLATQWEAQQERTRREARAETERQAAWARFTAAVPADTH